MGINPELLKLATWRLERDAMEKSAVVPPPPPGGDPMASGGAPPMDPSMMGGGAPPMDPSMMGGAPPMDPSMMGGGAPPVDGNQIRTIIQEELAAGKGGNGAGAGGTKKFDPEQVNRQLHTMNKFLSAIANALGVELPPEALLEPPEGEEAAPPAAPPAAAPAEAPAPAAPDAGGGLPADMYAGVDDPSAGSAISPIEPIQPASPELAKVGGVLPSVGYPVAQITPSRLMQKSQALAAMARQINAR